jgi:hypothetical protein
MDASYVLACGLVWMRSGKEDAGRELIRALAASDAIAHEEVSLVQAHLCAFEQSNHSISAFRERLAG